MRKLFLLFAIACSCFLLSAQENIAKLYPVGMYLNTGDVYKANYALRFGFERVFTKKLSGQFNLGVIFLRGGSSGRVAGIRVSRSTATMVTLEPQVHYYLMDDAPHGLYIGGGLSIGVGGGVNGAIFGIAPHVGYQYLLLDNRLAVSGQIGAGVGIDAGSNGALFGTGFYMPMSFGAGYAF